MLAEKNRLEWPKTQARASSETRTGKACSRGEGRGRHRTEERTLGKSEVGAAAVVALKARSEISAGADDVSVRNFPRLTNSQSWPFSL